MRMRLFRCCFGLVLGLSALALVPGCVGQSPPLPTSISTGAASPVLPPATPTAVRPSLQPSPSAAPATIPQGMAAVTSYRLDSNISFARSSQSDKSAAADNLIFRKTEIDLAGRKMRTSTAAKIASPPGQPAAPMVENQVYVIDGTIYIQGLFPRQPQMWTKTPAGENYWQVQNQAAQVMKLLPESPPVSWSGETIKVGNADIPCNFTQVTPDLPRLWTLMASQPGLQLPANAPPGVPFSQFVKNAQMKLWVAQAGDLPVSAELKMSIQIDPEQVPTLTENFKQDISMSLQFHDYNQPLSIELPAEARNAVELALQKSE
jgi:hypothetical protein